MMNYQELIKEKDKNKEWAKVLEFGIQNASEELANLLKDHNYQLIDEARDGDEYVFYFKLDDHIFQVTGEYCSWNGISFDDGSYDFFEVKPVEKTIIVYEPI